MTKGLGYLIALAGGLIFILFILKYKVYALENELGKINRDIKITRDTLRVLKAEFNYLNRPNRIRKLVNTLTPLQPAGEKSIFFEHEIVFSKPNNENGKGKVRS